MGGGPGGAPGGRRRGATLFLMTASWVIKNSGCTHPLAEKRRETCRGAVVGSQLLNGCWTGRHVAVRRE